jgi:hypothetical protein
VIRTLVILAIVSFLLSVGCLAGAFAIAGGPFYIDPGFQFHRDTWNIDISAVDTSGRLQAV